MLLSIALILVAGLAAGRICRRFNIPGLVGMILVGILLGPFVLGVIDSSILIISQEIRRIALIIILIRAGLKLSFEDLAKAGRPAVLLCFLPALFEIGGIMLIAPRIFDINLLDGAIIGSVVAAVSPAVVVPRMIRLIDEGFGTDKAIPQMILAGASVDDVFVIVIFTALTGLSAGGYFDVMSFVNIPVSLVLGVFGGFAFGMLILIVFKSIEVNLTVKALLLLSGAFLLNAVEEGIAWLPFASLIAIMALGMMIRTKEPDLAVALSGYFDKLWIPAEVFLFVLLGASVVIDSLKQAGPMAVILILGAMAFRMLGVFLCVLGTKFDKKERGFCMLAYTAKATVQAAIGGIPLAMGLSCGKLVLTISVVSILITAPFGAFAIDRTYKRLLKKAT